MERGGKGRGGMRRALALETLFLRLSRGLASLTSCGDYDLKARLEGAGGSIRGHPKVLPKSSWGGAPSFSVCARVCGHVAQVSPQALCQSTSELERLLCIGRGDFSGNSERATLFKHHRIRYYLYDL